MNNGGTSENIFCWKCGTTIVSSQNFCSKCGASQQRSEQIIDQTGIQEKKKSSIKKKIGLGVGIFFGIMIVLVIIGSIYSGIDDKNTSTSTPSEIKSTLTPSEIKSQAITDLSYDDLFRHNNNHIGKIVYYQGEVIQSQHIYGDTYVLRVGVTNKDLFYSDIIWVNYEGPRILENDLINLWGKVKGIKQYNAILGNTVEIPEIDAMIVEVVRHQG